MLDDACPHFRGHDFILLARSLGHLSSSRVLAATAVFRDWDIALEAPARGRHGGFEDPGTAAPDSSARGLADACHFSLENASKNYQICQLKWEPRFDLVGLRSNEGHEAFEALDTELFANAFDL